MRPSPRRSPLRCHRCHRCHQRSPHGDNATPGTPEAAVPSPAHPSHRCPAHKGWMNPPLHDVPPVSPTQGAELGLGRGPRVPVRGPGCPWCHSPCPQPRSPAAAFQACKTYWKSCGCKSWPPLRARNLSCNPERAAGSKHSGLSLAIPGLWNPLESLIRAGDASGAAGPPRPSRCGAKAANPGMPSQNLRRCWRVGWCHVDSDCLAPSQILPAPRSMEIPRVWAGEKVRVGPARRLWWPPAQGRAQFPPVPGTPKSFPGHLNPAPSAALRL